MILFPRLGVGECAELLTPNKCKSFADRAGIWRGPIWSLALFLIDVDWNISFVLKSFTWNSVALQLGNGMYDCMLWFIRQ
jgi:hypothetical protein